MALIVSTASSSPLADPTSSLKQALLDFEQALTDDQKSHFRAGSTPPDTSSAIAIVAQVDANNNSKSRRCVAPRLCTFLDSTQQFAGVVGTFVAILTASNIASYSEKVTSLIMTVGKTCPTYSQFGQLYPGSVELQAALCDYYATTVRLCIKIIEVSKRTTFVQTFSSVLGPFESVFKEFLTKLDQTVDEIKLQLSFASKKADQEAKNLLELESKDNATYRRLAYRFQARSSKEYTEAQEWRLRRIRRQAAKLRLQIQENLRPIDYAKPWNKP